MKKKAQPVLSAKVKNLLLIALVAVGLSAVAFAVVWNGRAPSGAEKQRTEQFLASMDQARERSEAVHDATIREESTILMP